MNPQRSHFRFRPSERLRLKTDFERVFANRCSASDGVLVVYAARNKLAWSRLAISVSKKIAKTAVKRNALRRRIREAYRTMKAELPIGFDLVCVAVKTTPVDYHRLAGSLRTLIPKVVRRCRARAADNKPISDRDAPAT